MAELFYPEFDIGKIQA